VFNTQKKGEVMDVITRFVIPRIKNMPTPEQLRQSLDDLFGVPRSDEPVIVDLKKFVVYSDISGGVP
jgi:hypothetical protein